MSETATGTPAPGPARPVPTRLRSEDRREALIEAAADLVVEGGAEAVTMDRVATRAEVSRPLVYKHFANRDELLAAVFRRQVAAVDRATAAAVEQAQGLDGKIRALIRAFLDTMTFPNPSFLPVVRVGVRDPDFRREQHARDRRTVRYFARLATDELGVGEAEAKAAMAVLLTGLDSIATQWRARPTPERRQFLEDLYVDLVIGGLTGVAARKPAHPEEEQPDG